MVVWNARLPHRCGNSNHPRPTVRTTAYDDILRKTKSAFCVYRFVKLQYQPVHSLDEACRVFQEETEKKENNQFVEGIMFSLNRGVIMTGNMVNSAEPGKVKIDPSTESEAIDLTDRCAF